MRASAVSRRSRASAPVAGITSVKAQAPRSARLAERFEQLIGPGGDIRDNEETELPRHAFTLLRKPAFLPLSGSIGAAVARQAVLVLLDRATALGAERDLVEAPDLALALEAGGVIRRKPGDQRPDAVAELEREVGRRSAHQLAHVLDGGLAPQAVRSLVLAHWSAAVYGAFVCTGMSSVS